MAGDAISGDQAPDLPRDPPEGPPQRGWQRQIMRVLRALGWLMLGLLGLLALLVAFLHTPPGRQLIVDQIGKIAPASGLSVEVGAIEGSVLWSSTLRDVKFRDANDVLFLEVPLIDLNWRPYKWFTSGLDIRHLVLTGGTLYAVPELIPGDPDAPILPDFDIRIDRFAIEDLRVAEGLLGTERVIDFAAEADIRKGLVYLDADGAFGGGDVFTALVHAEPDGDRFDLDLDWRAPAGGFLAAIVGADDDLAIRLEGEGSWTSWEGRLDAQHGGAQLLDFALYNSSGQYRIVGNARPGGFVDGIAARALGDSFALTASGTLESSVLQGDFALRARGVNADGAGAVDLAGNAFDGLRLAVQLLDPTLLGEGVALNDARLEAVLDGPFRDLAVPHTLTIGQIAAPGIAFEDITQHGTLSYDGARITVPVNGAVARITSGSTLFDPRLVDGTVQGTLVLAGGELTSDDLSVRFDGVQGLLRLNRDSATEVTRVSGPVTIADLAFDEIGIVDAGGQIEFTIGGGAPWRLEADVLGRVERVTNPTITSLAGENIRFDGGMTASEGTPIGFAGFNINASMLSGTLAGRIADGEITLAGSGRHADYGPFTVEALLAADGPHATLVFADPLPAAGLSDVRVALSPTEDGLVIETRGGSLLGAFDGLLNLNTVAREPWR